MEEIDDIFFETFMGKSFQGEHLEQVQKTAHEMKHWNLGKKGRNCTIKQDGNKNAEFIERSRGAMKKLRLKRETNKKR